MAREPTDWVRDGRDRRPPRDAAARGARCVEPRLASTGPRPPTASAAPPSGSPRACAGTGCDARVEQERAHGTYWWPLGPARALAGAAALPGRRRRGAGRRRRSRRPASPTTSPAGAQWFRRRLLPSRPTWNVVAEAGDRGAERTVVVVAHHDAAHTALLFRPAPSALRRRALPGPARAHGHDAAADVAGHRRPAARRRWRRCSGARALRTAGAVLSARRGRGLRRDRRRARRAGRQRQPHRRRRPARPRAAPGASSPVDGCGSCWSRPAREESFMEGMQAFARRHFAALPTDRTHVRLPRHRRLARARAARGRGHAAHARLPGRRSRTLVAAVRAARRACTLRRGLRFRNATDGLIALRAGYPTVMLGSVNRYKLPDNYHWPHRRARQRRLLDDGGRGRLVPRCRAKPGRVTVRFQDLGGFPAVQLGGLQPPMGGVRRGTPRRRDAPAVGCVVARVRGRADGAPAPDGRVDVAALGRTTGHGERLRSVAGEPYAAGRGAGTDDLRRHLDLGTRPRVAPRAGRSWHLSRPHRRADLGGRRARCLEERHRGPRGAARGRRLRRGRGRIAAFGHRDEQVVDSVLTCVAEFRGGRVVRAYSFFSVDDAPASVSARPTQRARAPPSRGGDLAGESRLGDLRQQLPELGAAGDAQLGRELVAADQRRLRPGGAPRERLVQHLAGELEMARRWPGRPCARASPAGRRR